VTGRTDIYRLFLVETGTTASIAFGLSMLAGLLHATLIFLVAHDAEEVVKGRLDWMDMITFLSAILVFGAILYASQRHSVRVCDLTVLRASTRLANYVRRCELADLERIGPAAIEAAVTRDIGTLGTLGPLAFSALKTASLVVGATVLILLTAPQLALLGAVIVAAMLPILRRAHEQMRATAVHANQAEDAFCGRVDDVLSGFKELKINTRKADDAYEHDLADAVRTAAERRIFAGSHFVYLLQMTLIGWFCLVGAACFVAPQLGSPEGIATAVLVLAFLRTPLADLASYVPAILNARLVIERVEALEGRLAAAASPAAQVQPTDPTFRRIRFCGLSYAYTDAVGAQTFRLGPFDLEINAGEVLLIAGSNGSGKSTLLKLLTGLYAPLAGEVTIDGRRVRNDEMRRFVSTVFSDFHLFDRLYGVGAINEEESTRLLTELDLRRKVAIKDGAFTTLDLSTGQRRRLALIAACLENRPILVFDEWTADQDPEFRTFFYHDLLPDLKRQGKTIIAVTHDDRYFRASDRLILLRDGMIAGRG